MSVVELSALELASGRAFGAEPSVELPGTTAEPRQALERACEAALVREPCVVSFSGGTDSSTILAIAARVARDRGLSPPIPVSLRFPGVPSSNESRWQELVIRHLGLSDWVRIEIGDELDFVGALARTGLSNHGLLWPANAHFHYPVFERARGGSVLTGFDGDGLFKAWRWQRAQAVLARRESPVPRDVLRVALAVAPRQAREAAFSMRQPLYITWLRPHANRRFVHEIARELASEPRPWPARVAWFARRRYLRLAAHSLALLAADRDVEVHHPLLDPAFLSALARRGGRAGYGTREDAARALVSDLLPADTIQRRSKAEFGRALWGPEARAFAHQWCGSGIDHNVVDANLLRDAWSKPNPPLAAATVLQHAWLQAAKTDTMSPAQLMG
jgi:hypothetical protein